MTAPDSSCYSGSTIRHSWDFIPNEHLWSIYSVRASFLGTGDMMFTFQSGEMYLVVIAFFKHLSPALLLRCFFLNLISLNCLAYFEVILWP